ncbi:guanine deaminase [Andreprevotia chitinilytica]|uniref:guanine deaminase n=1 Tax=Andreprevotia chitinilytica TaxID=396808 RepID=UPI00054FF585|nr:guanine deaminase [Andreprevotia chitinilytica]
MPAFQSESTLLVRGSVLHFLADPGENDAADSYQYFDDGYLWVEAGIVQGCGHWSALEQVVPAEVRARAARHDHRGRLILPGFVDTHMHYAQAGVIGSFGRQLLDWLNHYTFPAEAAFADPAIARHTADFVVQQLLAHGTTTASVFGTVHPASVDAFMTAAQAHDMRVLCGKAMMDRHCPDNVRDTAASAERESQALIERWHRKGRLRYSITPRFAPTSTPEQLAVAGALYAAWPDLHVQSHLAENAKEVAWVKTLFPEQRDYLDVYARYGLIGPRTIYGHCIHLSAAERDVMVATGTAAAFCPTSNLFLGSGFFDYAGAVAAGVRVGLATDIGGGTSFSMIRTLAEAYKVSQVHGVPLSPLRGWYLATLGGANALYLDDFIGNFTPGKEADFVVLDLEATDELAFRISHATTLAERLFALTTLGDDRCVTATYVMGVRAY